MLTGSPQCLPQFEVWSSEGNLASVSLGFRGRNIVGLVGNELLSSYVYDVVDPYYI